MAHHKKTVNGVNTYKYALKRPQATAKTSIVLRTTFYQIPFYYGIGYSIYPELWDKEHYRPTTEKKLIDQYKVKDWTIESDISDINTRIANIETTIDEYVRPVNRGAKEFDKKELIAILNKKIKKIEIKKVSNSLFITEYFNDLIERMTKGSFKYVAKATKKKIRYTNESIRNYSNLVERIKEFETYHNRRIKFDQVDMDFYNLFFDFLIEKDYRTNTIGKYLSRLKSALNIALDEGINSNRIFQNKSFAVPKVKVDTIALNDYDMERLENMKFPKRPHYQKALDTFLTGCYTLLRVSDYGKIDATSRTTIKDQDGREIECLKLIDQKTKKENLVPIQPKLERLLKKYRYKMPRMADQKVNQYIKEIAKEAKLTKLVPITDHDKEIIKKTPKYKLITTHTARRTGATQYFYNGMSPKFIQRLLNHAKLETTENYIKLDDSEMIKRIVQMGIFQPQESKVVNLKS